MSLIAQFGRDVWMMVSYVGCGVGAWLWHIISFIWLWCVGFMAAIIMLWPYILGWFAILGVFMVVGMRVDVSRAYMTESYMSLRLRRTRTAIHEIVAGHVARRFDQDMTVSHAHDWWYKRVLESTVAYRLICQIVDSEAWLKVDLKQIGLSISAERMTQIGDEVLAEVKAYEEVKKRMAAQDAMIRRLAKWWVGTIAYRLLVSLGHGLCYLGRGIRYVMRQALTLGCVVWELVKAAKTKQCPWMLFDTGEQSAGAQADAQAPHQPA